MVARSNTYVRLRPTLRRGRCEAPVRATARGKQARPAARSDDYRRERAPPSGKLRCGARPTAVALDSPKFAEDLQLDLADPLAAQTVSVADLGERVLAIGPEPVAQRHDLALTWRQRCQMLREAPVQIASDGNVLRRGCLELEQGAERCALADRGIERGGRRLRQQPQANLRGWHLNAFRDFVKRGLAPEFVAQHFPGS